MGRSWSRWETLWGHEQSCDTGEHQTDVGAETCCEGFKLLVFVGHVSVRHGGRVTNTGTAVAPKGLKAVVNISNNDNYTYSNTSSSLKQPQQLSEHSRSAEVEPQCVSLWRVAADECDTCARACPGHTVPLYTQALIEVLVCLLKFSVWWIGYYRDVCLYSSDVVQ